MKEDECLNEAVVAFTVTGSDNSGIDPTIVCYPASGYTFPLGTTTVTCTATDGNGNENTCEFTVTVEGNGFEKDFFPTNMGIVFVSTLYLKGTRCLGSDELVYKKRL